MIYRQVPGFPNYEVSNTGLVKSKTSQTILKQYICKRGYRNVYLYNNGKRKFFGVHQLVAMAFMNHTPCGHKIVVDHKDQDKQNNSLTNLRLVTNRFNCGRFRDGKSSKYQGVGWDNSRNKWRAQITINGVNHFLGRYNTELGAHEAYQKRLSEIELIEY